MSQGRLITFLVLTSLLVGLFIHYGAVAPRHDDSPSATALETSYPTHVGDHIYRWGRITEVREKAIVVQSGSETFIVLQRPPTASEGDVVQVDGRLAPDHRIVPNRIVVSDARGLTYMYGISALGGIWAAWLFARRWTIDRRSLTIISREVER